MSQWFGGSSRKPGKDPGDSSQERTPRGRGAPQAGARPFQEPQKRVNNGRGFNITPKKSSGFRDSGDEDTFGDPDYEYLDETQVSPQNRDRKMRENGRQAPGMPPGYGGSARGFSTPAGADAGQQTPGRLPSSPGSNWQTPGFGRAETPEATNNWPQTSSPGGAVNRAGSDGGMNRMNAGQPQNGNGQQAPLAAFYNRPQEQIVPIFLADSSETSDYEEQPEYEEEVLVAPVEHSELRKRAVAFLFDVIACYAIAVCVMLIPFVSKFLNVNLVLSLLLLVRDFFFDGRGVGKNLMGLQVVDATTGAPCSLKQSLIRNAILFCPYVLFQLLTMIVKCIPSAAFIDAITNVLNLIGAVYVTIVIPLEVYRVYSRDDGLRLGDQFAGTELVEADMNFSNPLRKSR
jgi:uncharacterized RDD family membrane protein YckC